MKRTEKLNYKNFNILFNVSKWLYSGSKRTYNIPPQSMAPDFKILRLG